MFYFFQCKKCTVAQKRLKNNDLILIFLYASLLNPCHSATVNSVLEVTNYHVITYRSPPHPLPPQCVTNHARQMGIQSSLHMPDKVLNFVKDHFLMDSVIRSAPLLLKRSVRYTQIAVHKIQGMERAYDVLFIGTG